MSMIDDMNRYEALEYPAPDPALYPCTRCGWGEMAVDREGVALFPSPLLRCTNCGMTWQSCDKDMDEDELVALWARYAVQVRRQVLRRKAGEAA